MTAVDSKIPQRRAPAESTPAAVALASSLASWPTLIATLMSREHAGKRIEASYDIAPPYEQSGIGPPRWVTRAQPGALQRVASGIEDLSIVPQAAREPLSRIFERN